MVQALIEIDDNTNRILNIVKAKYDLKDKAAAVEFVVEKFIEYENEPELRPEFVERMERVRKEKSIKVEDLAKRYGLDV